MVNQAFIIVIAYRPRRRRRRRRKIPGIGRYPMGPTIIMMIGDQRLFFTPILVISMFVPFLS